jgi:hypothetical protein
MGWYAGKSASGVVADDRFEKQKADPNARDRK